MAIRRYETYDYDFSSLDGPIGALQARSKSPNSPGQVAPPKGWIDLVVKLDAQLAELFPNYSISQVKSKFGQLRYYIGSWNSSPLTVNEDVLAEQAETLIRAAEHASYRICEVCGEPGSFNEKNAWAATLCPEHIPGEEVVS